MIDFVNVSHCHYRDVHFVPDLICKWSLIHASVYRFLIRMGLSTGNVNHVTACIMKSFGHCCTLLYANSSG